HYLIIKQGDSLEALLTLIHETDATAVYWNRRYEPYGRAEDLVIQHDLQSKNITIHEHHGTLLIDPDQLMNKTGQPYQVFTPFWKRYQTETLQGVHHSIPSKLRTPVRRPTSVPITKLHLEPTIDWAKGIRATWAPGESGARTRLKAFIDTRCASYQHGRDRPDHEDTSQLSPHLCFGEISPHTIWRTLSAHLNSGQTKPFHVSAHAFLRQIAWRDFAYHLLYHFPQTPTHPLREKFSHFRWDEHTQILRHWQKGRTGYPFVDAGMRQLWTTGWMHNRVRMITASFLTKHLLQPWQRGAEWFWDTLVDADLANNTMGWQWVTGCGADAAPYFRIFNPITQGIKFDPEGNYIRRWVPEIGKLPAPWIHQPWEAPPLLLAEHKVSLGTTYPYPIIAHSQARERALRTFAALKKDKDTAIADYS
ncbi:MAG: cryptochrome/photolyase family protein, partial [Nitrospirales bacterium]